MNRFSPIAYGDFDSLLYSGNFSIGTDDQAYELLLTGYADNFSRPAILHEVAHFWYSTSSVYKAINLLKLSALAQLLRATDAKGKQSAALGWSLSEVAETVLSPLMEGIAILAELDTPFPLNVPSHEMTPCDSLLMRMYELDYSRIEFARYAISVAPDERSRKMFRGLLFRPGAEEDDFKQYIHRRAIEVIERGASSSRKESLYRLPVAIREPLAGHTLGYLAMRDLYFFIRDVLWAKRKVFVSISLFTRFVREWFFAQPKLAEFAHQAASKVPSLSTKDSSYIKQFGGNLLYLIEQRLAELRSNPAPPFEEFLRTLPEREHELGFGETTQGTAYTHKILNESLSKLLNEGSAGGWPLKTVVDCLSSETPAMTLLSRRIHLCHREGFFSRLDREQNTESPLLMSADPGTVLPDFDGLEATIHGFTFPLFGRMHIGTVFRLNEQIICTSLRKQHGDDYFIRMPRDAAVNLLKRAEAAPVIGQMFKELHLAVNDPALLPAIQDARADIAWRITKSFIGNGYLFGPIGTMLDCTEMRTWDWETTGKSKMEVPGALRDIVFSHLKSKEWREFIDMTLHSGLGLYDAAASIRPDALVERLVRFEPDGRTRRSDPRIPILLNDVYDQITSIF